MRLDEERSPESVKGGKADGSYQLKALVIPLKPSLTMAFSRLSSLILALGAMQLSNGTPPSFSNASRNSLISFSCLDQACYMRRW